MTPKEKAEEIVDKMENDFQYFASREIAIKHALIAVDECLKTCVFSMIYYWQEVKHELEKL
jgi:hypothetical protein